MIFETTVLVRRWLEHPTYGVVAMLATVSRDKMVGQAVVGTHPAPTNPTVYSDVENPELAVADLDPAVVPALVVYVDENVEGASQDLSNKHYDRQRSYRATITYITRDEEAQTAVRNGGFTLRAAKKSLRLFNQQTFSGAFRELNKVKIVQIGPVVTHQVSGAVGKSRVWGFLDATLTVIDEDP